MCCGPWGRRVRRNLMTELTGKGVSNADASSCSEKSITIELEWSLFALGLRGKVKKLKHM